MFFLFNSDIGDEFHYILKCSYFINERNLYIKKGYGEVKYHIFRNNVSQNKQKLILLCKFIRIIRKKEVLLANSLRL